MSAVTPASLQEMSLSVILALFEDAISRLSIYDSTIQAGWQEDPRREALENLRDDIYKEIKRRDDERDQAGSLGAWGHLQRQNDKRREDANSGTITG